MVESSVQSTLISDGYAAFNKGDFATVRELFCDDTEENGEVFPLWEKMDHEGPIRGRTAIIDYLTGLREDGVKAKLLAVADHGHTAVTLDISTDAGRELDLGGGQGCAIVKGHTIPEREGPRQTIARDGPPRRQRRRDRRRARPIRPQRVENQPCDEGHGARERGRRLQRRRDARNADAQLTAALRGRIAVNREREDGAGDDEEDEQAGAQRRQTAHPHLYTWNLVSAPKVSTSTSSVQNLRKWWAGAGR